MAARPGEVRTSSAMAPQPVTPANVTYDAATGRLSIWGLGYQLACPNTLTVSWVSGPVANATLNAHAGYLPAVAPSGQIARGAPWPANASELNPVATVLVQDRITRWRRNNHIAAPPNEAPLHIPASAAAPGAGAPAPPMSQDSGAQYGGQNQGQAQQYGGQQQQYQGSSQGQGSGQQGQGSGQQGQSSGQQGQGQSYQGSGQGSQGGGSGGSGSSSGSNGGSGGSGGSGGGQSYSSSTGGSGGGYTSGVSAQSTP